MDAQVDFRAQEAAVENFINTLQELRAMMKSLNDMPVARLKDFDKVVQSGTEAAKAMQSIQAQMVKDARKSSAEMAKAMASGVEAGATTVKRQLAQMQAQYEAAVAKGWQVNLQTLQKMRQEGVRLYAEDKRRLLDALSSKELETAASRAVESARKRETSSLSAFQSSVERSTQTHYNRIYMLRKAAQARADTALRDDSAQWRQMLDLKVAAEAKAAAEIAAIRARNLAGTARSQVAQAIANPSGAYSAFSAARGGLGKVVTPTADPGFAEAGNQAVRALPSVTAFTRNLNDMHSAARGVASGFGAMWLTWGNLVPLLAGAALSNSVVQVVRLGAAVDDTMTRLRVLGGESAESVALLNEELHRLSQTGPFAPSQVAEAMKTLTLAGLSAKESLSAIQDVLNFSLAGDTDVKASAEALTTIATAFNVRADDYVYVTDIVAKAAAESKASVESMAEAMKTASVVHQQYGVTLEDTAVGLSLLANAGIQGTAAGTALRNMYVDLAGRTKEVDTVLRRLGVETLDKTTGKMREQGAIFKDLLTSLQSNTTPEQATKLLQKIFSERGAKEAIAILNALQKEVEETGQTATNVYDNLANKVRNAAGTTALAAAELSLTPLQQMRSVAATLQSELVKAFQDAQPYILEVSQTLKQMLNSDEFRGALTQLIRGVGSAVVFTLEWGKTIINVVLAWQGLKAAASVIAGITAVTTTAAAATTAVGVAAAGSTTAVGALGVALRAATLANPALSVLAGLVTAVGIGWAFLALNKKGAAEEDRKALALNRDAYLAKLNEEADRLEGIVRLKRESNALDAVAHLRREDVVSPADRRLQDAERALDAYTSGSGRKAPLKVDRLQREVLAAKEAAEAARETQRMLDRSFAAPITRVTDASAAKAESERRRAQEESKKWAALFQGKGASGVQEDDKRSGRERIAALALQHGEELKQVEKRYSDEIAKIKAFEQNAQTLLKANQDARLIDAGEFYASELILAEKARSKMLAEIRKAQVDASTGVESSRETLISRFQRWVEENKGKNGFAEKYLSEWEKVSNELGKLTDEYDTFVGRLSNDSKVIEDNALARMQLQAIKAKGDLKALDDASKEFWDGEAKRAAAAARQESLEDALRYASPEQAAYMRAAAEESERLLQKEGELQRQYQDAQEALESYTRKMRESKLVTAELTQGQTDHADAVARIKAKLDRLNETAPEIVSRAGTRALERAQKDSFAEFTKGVAGSVETALFEGGQQGKQKLRDLIVAELRKPISLVIQAIVNPIMGAVFGSLGFAGAANATSAGGSLLGTAATSAGTSALFGGASLSALGSAFGQGFMATLGGSTISGGTAAGLLAGGAAPGTGLAGTLGAAAPYALAAAAVLAALGAFRTTKTVGGGLTGTLGEGDIRAYDLRRKSGYLFGGPDYSTADRGVSEQSAALQAAFLSSRAAMAQTADAFDLGADAIRNFTAAIGSDLVHPDTGGLGLKLDGLNPEQVQAKVQAALAAANDAMAAELLGIKTTAVETVKRTVTEQIGSGEDREWINREVSEQITTTATALRRDLVPWMQRIADASGPTAATLQTIAEYPAKLLEVAGTSRDALVQAFAQGLVTGDAATAGQTVANALVASVEQAMLTNASGQIFDIVNRGIVTPMLDALLTGQTLTEALSQATIDATVAKATAAAQALGAVFNDPGFAAAMDQLRSSVGSALGTAGGALGFTAQYQQPAAAVAATASAGADSLGNAVGQLAQRFDGATTALLDNQQDLQDQLLRAQGRTAEANILARQRELAAYSDLAPEQQAHLAALYDQNAALRDQISAIEAAKIVAEQRARLERQLLEATGNTAALRALDLAALDESNRALQQRIWALQDEAAATNVLQSQMASARDALQGVVSLSAQQTDGLLGALQKRLDADRKALETNRAAAASLVQEVSGVFDALKTNVRDLFGEVDSTRQHQAAQGRAFIGSALATARAGGGLPSAAELSEAISAARGGLDAQVFASQAEADFQRLVLANELRDLQDISGSQLTEAERMLSVAESQLTALDGQLDAYREQIDVMRGVEQYTGTSAELLTRLLAAMDAERNLRTAVGASTLMGAGQATYNVGAQAGLTGAGQYFTQADALAAAAPFATGNANDALALYGAAQQSGFSLGQLEKIYGLGAGTLEDEVRKIEDAFGLTLPRFAVGTNYVPRDMLAVVHQGEAIVPAAYNPAANPGLGGGSNTERLERLVEGLTAEMQRLQSLVNDGNTHQRRTADTLTRVAPGDAFVTTPAPVIA